MQCDTCKKESPVVMRVVIAKDYNRALARPLYNCPACFESKAARLSRAAFRSADHRGRRGVPEPRGSGRGSPDGSRSRAQEES